MDRWSAWVGDGWQMALQDLPLGIRQIAGIWCAHPFNIPHRVYSVGSAHKNLLLSESDQGEQHDRGTTEGHIPHAHFLRFTLLNKTRSKKSPVEKAVYDRRQIRIKKLCHRVITFTTIVPAFRLKNPLLSLISLILVPCPFS